MTDSENFQNFSQDMLEGLSGARLVFDTETDGLYPSKLHCASFVSIDQPSNRFSLTPETIKFLPKVIEQAKLVIGHNILDYDIPHIERLFKITVPRSKCKDTLVMSRLADSARAVPPGCRSGPHSIEAWAIRFGQHKPSIEDWSVFTPEMLARNQSDTLQGFLVLKAVLAELKGFSKDSIDSEHDLTTILVQMQKDGVYIDQERAHRLYVEAKGIADEIQVSIQSVFGPKPVLIREVSPKVTKAGSLAAGQVKCLGDHAQYAEGPFSLIEFEEFNLDSPKQRVDRLLLAGWHPSSFTKPSASHPKGQPRFDADELTPEDLAALPKEAQLLGRYLMCRSRERTAKQWLDLTDSNSYIHGQVIATAAWSGRGAHKNPNTANVAGVNKDKDGNVVYGVEGGFGYESRDCWRADPRNPGEVLLGVDLTAIQLRAFAHYTADMDYIKLVADPSADLHTIHAGYLGGVPRPVAKRWLYAFLLGAGNAKLGRLLGGSTQDGTDAAQMFMEKVPGVRRLKDSLIPRWADQGFMLALDGRKIPVMSQHLALTAALQSFEKCVIAHSIIGLKNTGLPYTLRIWCHDELQMTCKGTERAKEIGLRFKDIVAEVGVKYGSLCPLTADYHIGASWAETH